MTTRSGTARRLAVAFAVLLAILAVSSWFAISSLGQVERGLARIADQEDGVRRSLELASAVRDQYAHQAHTIILGDASHLPYYEAAEARVVALTRQVRTHVSRPDEVTWVGQIERSTGELDLIFRQRIVPAVLAHREEEVQEQHGQAQLVVTRIQDLADRLVSRFESSIADTRQQLAEVRRAALRWTVFFLAGAPLLAAGIGFSIYRSVARPVALLGEGAARLAAGQLDTRIEVDTPDEFGALARQFNAMTASLAEHQERLVQSRKLAGIGRLAAGVAHEINNPLAVILGYAKILQRRAEGELAADLRVVEDEALRAQQIVEGLLDLSRPLSAPAEPVALRELCDEAVARLGETGRLNGATVLVEGGATVMGHPQKLRQVLLNLVRNGAEAAGEGGRVSVTIAGLPGGMAEVAIQDTGQGIPEEARGKLFEPFFSTKVSGTGLGLAVSLSIVQGHGGTLEAESPAGGGARFVIRLPPTPPGRV
jgi:signal transduction histidine kinase